MARRVASESLRGFGVDTTISGAFQRNVALEARAIQATNAARTTGQDVAASSVVDAVRATQKKFGTGEDTIGALEQFQKVTGDLNLGMQLMDGLALRSVTTGAKMDDLAAAAANVSNNLGDIPNKQQAILDLLDQFTVQGAQGAVEISDMAKEAAKLAAAAPQFGGDTGKNMALLGAMAQVARAQGGAASAQQASTSITSFANTFTKGARLKALEKAGIQAIDPVTKQIMNPRELVKQILAKSGGDPLKMNTMVMDVQAKRAIRGFQVEYNKAGGGDAGLKAVDALFDKFLKGGIGDDVRAKNLSAHQNSTAAKVAKFQTTMDEVAQSVQAQLLPALEKLAPHAAKVAETFGEVVAWAAENPGRAITAAIVASIGRAGLESVFRAAIERAIMGGAIGAPGGGGGKGGRGALALGAATGVALLGVDQAISQFGELEKDIGSKQMARVTTDAKDLLPGFKDGKFSATRYAGTIAKTGLGLAMNPLGTAADLFQSARSKVGNLAGSLSFSAVDSRRDADVRAKEKAKRQAEADAAIKADDLMRNSGTRETWQAKAGVTAEQLAQAAKGGNAELEKVASLVSRQDKTVALLTAMNSKFDKVLKVEVQNFPEGGGDTPTVDESGRES